MAEQTLKEQTAKGLFWGGLSNGIQQILNLVFGLVLARILDPNDYGLVGMLAIFSAIASTIQESGFTSALTNQKKICDEDYNAVFWFSSLTGILFYIILFFSTPLIAIFYDKPELVGLSRIVFLGFLFSGFGIASNAYLFKNLMVKERAKIDILSLLISGVFGVTLALNGYSYIGLAIQTVIYIGVGTLLRLYYSPWHPMFRFNFKPLKRMFVFSSKLIITNIFTQISNNIFSVILGKFYNPRQLGFYTQGQKWMGMGNQLIWGMINSVAHPVLAHVVDDKERQRDIFRKMVRFGAFVSFPAMLGLAFVAKEFILIFLGTKWSPSVPFLQLFCLWGACGYLSALYTNLLMSHGKSNVYLYGMVFIGFLQLTVVFSLFVFGIYPMVLGYIITYYIGLLFWHYWVHLLIGVELFQIMKDIMPYLAAICFSILISYFIAGMFSNVILVFILKIIITAIMYLSVLWFGNSVILKDTLSYLLKKRF